ncbi:hypothetical protein [Deinococcus hopiensis]|uniref:DNA-binding transcriptional activator of the SARP family n=1 Tax=Deinococcus hopiensis KR-140 TaxID=695939 RepID=A0A1W1VJP5_9DEIO|nr:hypothetical protein [Deinococcus hopiensis]SMB93503.1 DNA-binding transcriptional activator of the SARP family [Deinococcus hopiensis KR-140]
MSELLHLRRLVARGRGTTLVLCGPAGIGKTHAATALLGTLPCRTVRVPADAALAALFRMTPTSPREPAWVAGVQRRLEAGDGVPPAQAAAALHARLKLHLPAVLVADHLHRCTPAGLDFWQALGELVRGSKGLGLLALTRTQAPEGWTAINVEPLCPEESAALVGSALGSDAPGPLHDWLYGRAQGHPLYTLELLRHLQRQGAVQVLEGRVRWKTPERESLPPTLEGLVRSLLPPQPGRALWRALAALLLTGRAGEEDGTAELTALGLIRNGQPSHPLYGDALLPLIPPGVLSETLEHVSQADRLNDPLRAARLLDRVTVPDEVARRILEAAARRAGERGDSRQAAEHWERLAQIAPPAEAWPVLWAASKELSGGGTLYGERSRDLARRSLEQRRAAGGPEVTLDEWRWMMTLQAAVGASPEELLAEVPERWHAELRDHDQLERVIFADKGDHTQGVALWEALPQRLQEAANGKVLLKYGTGLFLQLRLDEAEVVLKRALERIDTPYDRCIALNNLALVPLYRGEFHAAQALLETMYREAQGNPNAAQRAETGYLALGNLAMALERTGEVRRALETGRQILAESTRFLSPNNHYRILSQVGQHLTTLGEFTAAQGTLMEAHDLHPYVMQPFRHVVLVDLINLYFLWQTEASVPLLAHFTAQLEELIQGVPDVQVFQPLCVIAQGLAASGQPTLASVYADRAAATAQALNMTQGFPLVAWVRSLIHAEEGAGPAAAQVAREAQRLAAESGDTYKAEEYALWAALFARDGAELEAVAGRLAEREYHGVVHAVRSRWQAERAASTVPDAQTWASLQVLGDVRVWTASGQPYTSRPGRALLALLLCARLTGEDGLSQTDVLEALFPEREEAAARQALRRLLTRLRSALGPGSVVTSGDRLLLGHVQSDAELFLQTGDPGLWRGPFLGDEPPGEHTEAAHALLLTRLEGLTEASLETAPETAERLAALLCRWEPYETRLLALLLRAHDAAGHPRQAGAAYRRAWNSFAEVGQVLPPSWQAFLAEHAARTATPALVALSGGAAGGTVSAARQARALQVHRSTVLRWQKGETRRPGQPGRPGRLPAEALERLRQVLGRPPQDAGVEAGAWSLAHIADYVEAQYGVRLSRAQLSRLLRREPGAVAEARALNG